MISKTTMSPEPIPADWQPKFAKVCRRFALEWENNESPDIDSFAGQIHDKTMRSKMVGVLIALEVRLQSVARATISLDQYKLRFPQHNDAIEYAFDEAKRLAGSFRASDTRSTPGDRQYRELPEKLGRYRIEQKLGVGGFGLVCLATDTALDRLVALKLARQDRFGSQEQMSFFIREARTAAQLEHPSIITVYDVKRFDQTLCIVQQYIDGVDLKTELSRGIPDFKRTASICRDIAVGLSFAHGRGFIHRDIKPANILLDKNGEPHIGDFGLAIHESRLKGQEGNRPGTPRYMPPEIVLGEMHRVDGRSDLWSLGVMMYVMLTGSLPFQSDELDELFKEIQTKNPTDPRSIDSEIPAELERICLKCLSKRASDRYVNALRLVEDLSHFLESTANENLVQSSRGIIAPRVQPKIETSNSIKSGNFAALTELNIVPKGLRSFDAHDADFFLHLLPGPKDRLGHPNSIRFWKQKIEDRSPDSPEGIGLIYGPSGCGKSSFVKAGLLPVLQSSITSVYIEATQSATETRLLNSIRNAISEIPSDISLDETISGIRDGFWLPPGQKLLIVIDQFEQWLHERDPEKLTLLTRALRQCDGRRVECVLMVRDDFWLATSRFMRALEVDLRENRNSTLIDLFDLPHSKKVLCEFGRAYGALPESSQLSKPQKRFVTEVVDQISEQGKIICVHLALFAEMFKDKPWTIAELNRVGGARGVGLKFLEDTFVGPGSNPEFRRFESGARKFLGALLPQVGTDIRGQMLPVQSLREISGFGSDKKSFETLTRILDSDLRLISLTDPAGGTDSNVEESSDVASHYQLTHDFLVGSLRRWLTQKQQATVRGRAELRLKQRAATWTTQPENEYLPGVVEYSYLRSLTRKSSWTPDESKMMRKAGWIQGIRTALILSLVGAASWAFLSFNQNRTADNFVSRLLEAETADVPSILSEMKDTPFVASKLDSLSREISFATNRQQRIHVGLARIESHPEEITNLTRELLLSDPVEAKIIIDSLSDHVDGQEQTLWEVVESNRPTGEKLRALAALAHWDTNSPKWSRHDETATRILAGLNPIQLGPWAENFRLIGERLLPIIATKISNAKPESTSTTNLIGLYEKFSGESKRAFDGLSELARSIKFQPQDLEKLTSEFENEPSVVKDALVDEVTAASRQANIAVAMIRLDPSNELPWGYLRSDENLTRRSFIIQRLYKLNVDEEILKQRLEKEKEPQVRAAILLALGDYAESISTDTEFVEVVRQIYSNDPDSFTHSAAEWLLRQLNPESPTPRLRANQITKSPEKDWYIIDTDLAMVTVKPRNQLETIDYDFAISSKEISYQQYLRFSPIKPNANLAMDRFLEKNPGAIHGPVNLESWYDAAAYCNWLSKQNGIPKDQWCYVQSKKIKLSERQEKVHPEYYQRTGLTLAKNWQTKSGFRLPTESEWEFACMAESRLTWNCGKSLSLLRDYAWYRSNIDDAFMLRPSGQLKPNRIGLFDMHGNADELVLELETDEKDRTFTTQKGGSVFLPAFDLNCYRASKQDISGSSEFRGFRVVQKNQD
jgi:serine/threonine protein kinase